MRLFCDHCSTLNHNLREWSGNMANGIGSRLSKHNLSEIGIALKNPGVLAIFSFENKLVGAKFCEIFQKVDLGWPVQFAFCFRRKYYHKGSTTYAGQWKKDMQAIVDRQKLFENLFVAKLFPSWYRLPGWLWSRDLDWRRSLRGPHLQNVSGIHIRDDQSFLSFTWFLRLLSKCTTKMFQAMFIHVSSMFHHFSYLGQLHWWAETRSWSRAKGICDGVKNEEIIWLGDMRRYIRRTKMVNKEISSKSGLISNDIWNDLIWSHNHIITRYDCCTCRFHVFVGSPRHLPLDGWLHLRRIMDR